jgi:hypothetical protein
LIIELISASFEALTKGVWCTPCRRLRLPVSPDERNDRLANGWAECRSARDSELKGIMAHLTQKYWGCIMDTGVVLVTASAVGRPEKGRIRVLVDFDYFCFLRAPNSWICYDF